jgi:hypothetical protein
MGQQASQFGQNQNNWLNTNAWNQNMDLAHLGNPGAANSQGYGSQQGDIYSQQGNVNAAGQVGQANAWNAGLGQLGQYGVYAAGNYGAGANTVNGKQYNPYD